MKKVLAIILSLILILSFVGCKKNTAKKDDEVNSSSSSNTTSGNKTSSNSATQNKDDNSSNNDISSSITTENVKINSLDKLNFYAVKKAIAEILLEEGYIAGYEVHDNGNQGTIRVTLKYGANKSKVIQGLKRVSKPGLRVYSNCEDMPKVMNGLGIAIVSTSKGVMTDKKARQNNVGGEVLAFVW